MNRYSNRRATALAALSAAALLATTAERSLAQVWNNPNTGSWNNAINWAGGIPVSGAATALTFNASGAQSYTSTNDMPTNPFQVGSLNFSNTGTGTITVNGNPLTGGTATGGAYVRTSSTGAGTSEIANGGTLYSLRVGQGLMKVTGGTWQLTSTQRQNDIIAGINDGFWGLNIGDTDSQTSRFMQTGGTINGDGFAYLGVANNSISFATFSGASSVLNFTNATNGRAGVSVGQGTISIENGATWNVRLIEGARSDNSRMNMFVNGPTSSLNSALQILLCRGLGTNASLTVSNGALAQNNANSFYGTSEGSNANLTVTGANSRWNNLGTTVTSGGSSVVGTGDPLAPGTTNINASLGGQVRSQVFNLGQQNGGNTNVTVDGSTMTSIGVGAAPGAWAISGNLGKSNLGLTSSLVNITLQNNSTGGVATNFVGGTAFTGSETNSGGGRTSLTVQSGSTLSVGNVFLLTANDDCIGTMSVNNGTLSVGGEMDYGSGINTKATVSITNGGRVTTLNAATAGFMSTDVGSTTSVTVNNGTLAYASTLVTSGGSQGTAGDQLPSGNTTISLSNGARLAAQSMNLTQNTGGFTDITVDGATTVMTSVGVGAGTGSWVTANNLGAGDPVSRTRITVQNGATASVPANLWGSGGLQNSQNGISTFAVQSGGKLNVGEFVILSDPTGSQSHMTVTGANSQLSVGTSLLVGGNGTLTGGIASVTVTDSAVATVTSFTNVFPTSTMTIGTGTSKGTLQNNGDMDVNGTVNFNAGTFNTVGTLGVGGSVILSSAGRAPNGTASNKKMVEVGQVDMTASGVIDLNDNDMLLHNDTVVHVQSLVAAARNGGLWNQPGITSTAAKNAVPQNKNLGVVSGANFLTAGVPTFNGKTVVAGDTLVKFTFNGDTDLNGTVDFDDYSRVDNGFNNNRTGWFNGDFDYNGVVDFDDYSLIDQAFNTQGIVVLNATGGELAGPGARTIIWATQSDLSKTLAVSDGQVLAVSTQYDTTDAAFVDGGGVNGGSLQAVPEPATLGVIGIGMLGALRRRRRHA